MPERSDADGAPIEFRVTIPRSSLPQMPPADYYSQKNCERLLGMPRRKFLELLRRPGAPEVFRVGKLRMVRRAAFQEFLERIEEAQERADRLDPEELDEADRLLLDMGCTPKGQAG